MELFELQTRCEQLTSTIKALESQLSLTNQEPTDRETGTEGEGERELFQHQLKGLGELLAHNRETQDQLLKCQKENMRLRFEYEQAVVELPRLQVGGASHVTCEEYHNYVIFFTPFMQISTPCI